MCGRFVRGGDSRDYAEAMEVAEVPEVRASFNVAPTQAVLAARLQDGAREAAIFQWGLKPPWAKFALINLRDDTLAEKKTFKKQLAERRCIIPADGYFEWAVEEGTKKKTPHYFRMKDERPFVFAGLWDDDEEAPRCALITTEPNALQQPIHNRMPVILPKDAADVWMKEEVDRDTLLSLLKPYPAEAMTCYAVSTLVNSPKNNNPHCIEPAA